MSRLDDLIAQYCPDGVEYKELGTLCAKTQNIRWDNTKDSFRYVDLSSVDIQTHSISETSIITSEDAPSRAQQIIFAGDILFATTRPTQMRVCVVPEEYDGQICSTGYCVIRVNPDVNRSWVFHCLGSGDFKQYLELNQTMGNYPAISNKLLLKYRIPVPPLPVQEEIVRILDKMTTLKAELTAELTARRSQYSYYRDKLLGFEAAVLMMPLGETCDMKAGKAIDSIFIHSECSDEAPYECFGGNGLRGYVSSFSHDGAFPLIGRQGALCGNVAYAQGRFYATEHAVVVQSKGLYSQRFLYHLLTHMELNQYKSAGAQPGLSVKNLMTIPAPVPPLAVQQRIVNVLDNFEQICSDLRIGLPAEIEARQRQYEYYRDLLLTFVTKGDTLLTDRPTDRPTD